MQNLGAGRQTKCIVDSWKLEKCKVKVIRRDGMGCIRKGRDGREEKGGEGRGGEEKLISLFIIIIRFTYQSCFHSFHLLVSQQSAEKTGSPLL